MALVAGRDSGNDMMISKQQMEERIKGYRNFSNKIWNIARFIEPASHNPQSSSPNTDDGWIESELNELIKSVTGNLEKYRLGQAAEEIYEFVWHKFADVYIEKVKNRK